MLVVSCPCALGLALPLSDEIATMAARRSGVFVRENDLWARLGRVRKIVFDKTGTLTLETPALANPEELHGLDQPARTALLTLVRDNVHPVSRCLHENLLALGLVDGFAGAQSSCPAGKNGGPNSGEAESGKIHEEVGFGVRLHAGAETWTLGRPGWRGGPPNQCHVIRDIAAGARDTEFRPDREHVTYYVTNAEKPDDGCHLIDDIHEEAAETEFCRDGNVLARFRFVESVRADARIEVAALRASGREVFILSGDRREKVLALARELGLPPAQAIGEVSPHGKAGWVQNLDRQDTLMLGDGANDSLAFDSALCRGTPVVHGGLLEQKADFYYLWRGIGGIRRLFAINRSRQRTQAWILGFAILYNLVAVSVAVAGLMSPLLAAILMPASSLATLAIVGAGLRRHLHA